MLFEGVCIPSSLTDGVPGPVYPPYNLVVYCWAEPSASTTYMVKHGSSGTVQPINSDGYYGTWGVDDHSADATELATRPAGKKCIRMAFVHDWCWTDPDNRCDGVDLSVSPDVQQNAYRNGTGGDGKDSGFSHAYNPASITKARAWGAAAAANLSTNGLTELNYLMFDQETRLFAKFDLTQAWRTAIYNSASWDDYVHAELDRIIALVTEGVTTSFSTTSFDAGDSDHQFAWDCFERNRSAMMMEAILHGFQEVYPECMASNYEHHGRLPAVMTAMGRKDGGISDLNGNEYAQEITPFGIASDYNYAWLGGIGIQRLMTPHRLMEEWGNHPDGGSDWGCDFNMSIYEHRKRMAELRSGQRVMPWIGWVFDDCNWCIGHMGGGLGAGDNPYWKGSIAMAATISGGTLLMWNSRTYNTSGLPIQGADAATKKFWTNGRDYVDFTPGNGTSSITIAGSTGGTNDGKYLVDYILYNATDDRTEIHLENTETIPDDTLVDLGNLPMICNDAMDEAVDGVMVDFAAEMTAAEPRRALVNEVSWGPYNTTTGEETVGNGDWIHYFGFRHGTKVTYCVNICRVSNVVSDWSAETITCYRNGSSIGTFTVPADEVYAYHTIDYVEGDVIVFTWPGDTATNLITNEDLTDTGYWTHSGIGSVVQETTGATAMQSPLDSSWLYYTTNLEVTKVITGLTTGHTYTLYAYIYSPGPDDDPTRDIRSCKIAAYHGSDSTTVISTCSQNNNAMNNHHSTGEGTLKVWSTTFMIPTGETSIQVRFGHPTGRGFVGHVGLVKGICPPIVT